jgi:hypothetical protein
MNTFNHETYLVKFNEFLEIRNLTENTIINYNSFLKKYLSYVDSVLSKLPDDVSYSEIRIYILVLKNTNHLSPASINSHISQLRFFYAYVLMKPFDKYQVPFMKITRNLPVIYSKKKYFISLILLKILNTKLLLLYFILLALEFLNFNILNMKILVEKICKFTLEKLNLELTDMQFFLKKL